MKPTVTQLINLLDKPGLLKWANNIGLQGIKLEDYRKQSKGNGTSLHRQVQMFVERKIPFENAEHQNKFNQFISNKEFIDLEKNIETDWFVGRYDARIRCGKREIICDFKSSSAIYLEQKLQLTAYKMAYPDCGIAIVQIPDFILKPVEIDFKKCELILKCLHKIWELKQLI